jgi:chromatin segregation and condensation protein Rec8/ScpA/Scc1 (kleisin family)
MRKDDMDVDEEDNEEDEENEEEEDDIYDESGEFKGIKSIIEKKKKEKQDALEALGKIFFSIFSYSQDPNLDDKSRNDVLEIDLEDWDNKFTPLHYAIYFGHVKVLRKREVL